MNETMRELIWRYFENDLTDTERLEFEKLLLTDSEVRMELETMRRTANAASAYAKSLDISIPHGFENQVLTRARKKTSRIYYYATVASAAAILLLTVYFSRESNSEMKTIASADTILNTISKDMESLSPSWFITGDTEWLSSDDYSAPEEFSLTGDEAKKVLTQLESSVIL